MGLAPRSRNDRLPHAYGPADSRSNEVRTSLQRSIVLRNKEDNGNPGEVTYCSM